MELITDVVVGGTATSEVVWMDLDARASLLDGFMVEMSDSEGIEMKSVVLKTGAPPTSNDFNVAVDDQVWTKPSMDDRVLVEYEVARGAGYKGSVDDGTSSTTTVERSPADDRTVGNVDM